MRLSRGEALVYHLTVFKKQHRMTFELKKIFFKM